MARLGWHGELLLSAGGTPGECATSSVFFRNQTNAAVQNIGPETSDLDIPFLWLGESRNRL